METRTAGDGQTVYVAREEWERGSKDAFYAVYLDPDREEAYGYLCAHCDTLENAMDTMGRIVCNECGNTKKPEEWDAAHE